MDLWDKLYINKLLNINKIKDNYFKHCIINIKYNNLLIENKEI